MKYRVIIEDVALAEIEAAFTYIVRQSPDNAERWLIGLFDAIGRLESFPERFALAREDRHFSIEVRQLLHHSHRIIFTIRDRNVHVLHVRHAAMRAIDPFSET